MNVARFQNPDFQTTTFRVQSGDCVTTVVVKRSGRTALRVEVTEMHESPRATYTVDRTFRSAHKAADFVRLIVDDGMPIYVAEAQLDWLWT